MSPSSFSSPSSSPVQQAPRRKRLKLDTSDDRSGSDSDTSGCNEETVPVRERCKYPGKFCGRARVQKSNGTFHRFCQHHRDKANANQKRWATVRRKQAAKQQQHQRAQELAAQGHVTPAPRQGTMDTSDPWSSPAPLPHQDEFKHWNDSINSELTPEDVGILHALLGYDPAGVGYASKHATNESHTSRRSPVYDWSRYYGIPHNFWNIR